MDADRGNVRSGPPGARHRDWRGAVAVLLLGTGLAWAAGNVGPVVADLQAAFGISLASIGVLSGTLLYIPMVVGILLAPAFAERVGLVRAMVVGCLLGAVGSLLFALASGYVALAAGRILSGLGLGIAGVLGPVFARASGGVRRVGIFGAAFQLGIAGGLGVGGLLGDLGAEWRVGFFVSAAVALSAIPFLVGGEGVVELGRGRRGFWGAAARSGEVWRLGALFTAMFAVPLTLGAWFVHYITEDGGLAVALAGGFAFLLFGVSALMRTVGARLAARGIPPALLTGASPALAAIGLVAIAVDRSPLVVAVAMVLLGAGFALPYATMMTEAQKLFPAEPAKPTALLTMAGTAVAVAAIPVMGAVLAAGAGAEAFVVLAVFVALAGLVNLRPVTYVIEASDEIEARSEAESPPAARVD
jgi:fucose permease